MNLFFVFLFVEDEFRVNEKDCVYCDKKYNFSASKTV